MLSERKKENKEKKDIYKTLFLYYQSYTLLQRKAIKTKKKLYIKIKNLRTYRRGSKKKLYPSYMSKLQNCEGVESSVLRRKLIDEADIMPSYYISFLLQSILAYNN